jgi:hypothetical protein
MTVWRLCYHMPDHLSQGWNLLEPEAELDPDEEKTSIN